MLGTGEILAIWAQHLQLKILEFIGVQEPAGDETTLGQSVCISQKTLMGQRPGLIGSETALGGLGEA